MLKQMPKGISPRFSLHPSNFQGIADALNNVGHVVVEDVFNVSMLNQCEEYAISLTQKLDTDYSQEKYDESQIYAYFGSTFSFQENEEGKRYKEIFFDMVDNSLILDLYTFLIKGNIAMIHGPMLRRIDPQFPARHIVIHNDTQLAEYVENTYEKNSAYSMWTPLVDIDEQTSSLLLFGKGCSVGVPPGTPEDRLPRVLLEVNALNNLSYLFNNEAGRLPGDELWASERGAQYCRELDRVIEQYGDDVFAPTLSIGSVIIFTSDIFHGSFVHPGVKKPRYSIDIRFIGDFNKQKEYTNKENAYIFKRYAKQFYNPHIQHVQHIQLDPHISISVQELQQKVSEQNQKLLEQESKLNYLLQNMFSERCKRAFVQFRATVSHRVKRSISYLFSP